VYKKILVPLDGSELAECVLPHVEELAESGLVKEIVLLRICDSPSIVADYPEGKGKTWEKHVEQLTGNAQQQCSLYINDVEQSLKDKGFKVKAESRLGKPADEIVNYANKNKIDLIVMASHGRSGISRWAYGSVAEKVLRSSCVPVLLVKVPGCVTGF
jgi:nucleotide-binding universal stress UspA family protein